MQIPTILVIDDDRAVGQALTGVLGELGHEVHWTASGHDGVERLKEPSPSRRSSCAR
jgi:CheY-like chemotaxis protein